MRCARYVSPYSSSCESGSVVERSARYRIGAEDGSTFPYDGGIIPGGSWLSVLAIADCTSCAAASMLRSRVNCRVMDVSPWLLCDDIWSMPAMVENCFSSGVATEDAIVSALAPGRLAPTEIVG